jgi:flagellar biosynthesis component FlhA
MTKNNLPDSENKKNDSVKKRQFFLMKLVILISLIFFGYFGFKYWKNERAQHSESKIDLEKNDNSDGDIFDLSDEYKNQHDDQNIENFPDLTANELKEKGAEFIYQMLLKNQVQINDLKEQMQALRAEFVKYKNQEKIGKMIFAYIDFRQKIFSDFVYEDSLKNFEMLSVFDQNLQAKIVKLKPLLADLSRKKNLNKSFNELIPSLIAKKNINPDSGFISKIRYQISKLIVIRRIDGKNVGDVDEIVSKTEKLLREQNYQEALNSLLRLDQSYHEILVNFLDDLSNAAEIQKIDQEILNYLKNLT